MRHTGSLCPLNGFYRTTCACAESLEFVAGSTFPCCISCGEPVPWVYLQPLAPSLGPVSGAQAVEVESHVRKLQACLQRETDPTLLFALGRSLLQLGRIGPALEVIYGVLDHAPDNVSAHLELGRALLGYRQPQDAIRVLERGAQIALRIGDSNAEQECLRVLQLAQPPQERRRGKAALRVPLDVTITRSDGLHPGVYTAVNISETGLCICSARREPLGTFVALSFLLEDAEVHVYGQVVWCRDDLGGTPGRPFKVGLQFLSPTRSIVERIRDYVSEQAEAGLLACRSPSQAG